MTKNNENSLEFLIEDAEYKILESAIEMKAVSDILNRVKRNLPEFPELYN